MKMIMAVIQADDTTATMEALVNAGYRVTRMATTGGWLRRENVTLLLGAEDEQVVEVLQVLSRSGHRRNAPVKDWHEVATSLNAQTPGASVEVGGATVFVLNVEKFARY
jgi:uncharacterized protein YaaQ